MNSRLIISTFVLLIIALGTTAVRAQEDRMPDLESGRDMRFDPPLDTESDEDYKITRPVVPARDSVYLRPSPRKPDAKGKTTDENSSVLGFNFLYYLIERYKLSDIVD